MQFHEKLKSLMLKKFESGDRHQRLAEAMKGTEKAPSRSTIRRWTEGELGPKPPQVRALASYFGVPAGYLIDDSIQTVEPAKDELDQQTDSVMNKARQLGLERASHILEQVIRLGYDEAADRLLQVNKRECTK